MGENEIDKSAEELSALMDGEVSELELRRILKNVQQDSALADKWARYQLSSAVLKKQTNGQASRWAEVDLSARIQKSIDAEPAFVGSDTANVRAKTTSRSAFLKPFANVAVAASVSAAVILGWQNFGQSTSSLPSPVASNNAPSLSLMPSVSTTSSPFVAVSQGSFSSQSSAAPQQEVIRYSNTNDDRLNRYLLSHSGNAAMTTASSMAPYARVVSIKPAQTPAPIRVNLEK